MKRSFYLIIAIFVSFYSFGQDTINRHLSEKYVSLSLYKERFGDTSDTTVFRYQDGDTLIKVPSDWDPFKDKKYVKVEYEPKDSTFLSIYKNVVYNTHKGNGAKECMRYWKNEIKIYFDESVPTSHAKELMQFTRELSGDIDSLTISQNFIPEKANYLVYFLNSEHQTDYEPRIENSKGGYYISWNGKQQIYDGKLKINTELVKSDKYQLQLLKFHFLKSLGYFKSSNQLDCSSYFSACNTQRKLSSKDLEILKYHYSYGVCKGTDLKNFIELTTSMNKKLEEDPKAKLYVLHDK